MHSHYNYPSSGSASPPKGGHRVPQGAPFVDEANERPETPSRRRGHQTHEMHSPASVNTQFPGHHYTGSHMRPHAPSQGSIPQGYSRVDQHSHQSHPPAYLDPRAHPRPYQQMPPRQQPQYQAFPPNHLGSHGPPSSLMFPQPTGPIGGYPHMQTRPHVESAHSVEQRDWREEHCPELAPEVMEALEEFMWMSNQGFEMYDEDEDEFPPGFTEFGFQPMPQFWKNFVKRSAPVEATTLEIPTAGDFICIKCHADEFEEMFFYNVVEVKDTVVVLKYNSIPPQTIEADLAILKEYSVTRATAISSEPQLAPEVKQKRDDYVYPELGSGISIRMSSDEEMEQKEVIVLFVDNVKGEVHVEDMEDHEKLSIPSFWNYEWEYLFRRPKFAHDEKQGDERLIVENDLIFDALLGGPRNQWAQCLTYALNSSLITYDLVMLITARVVRCHWLEMDDGLPVDTEKLSQADERIDTSSLRVLQHMTGYQFDAIESFPNAEAMKAQVVQWIDEKRVVVCNSETYGVVAVCDYETNQANVKCVSRGHCLFDELSGPFVVVESATKLKGYEMRDRFQLRSKPLIQKIMLSLLSELKQGDIALKHPFVDVEEVESKDDEKEEAPVSPRYTTRMGTIHTGMDALIQMANDLARSPDESVVEAAKVVLTSLYAGNVILECFLKGCLKSPRLEHDYARMVRAVLQPVSSCCEQFRKLLSTMCCITVEDNDKPIYFVLDGNFDSQVVSQWVNDEYVAKLIPDIQRSIKSLVDEHKNPDWQ